MTHTVYDDLRQMMTRVGDPGPLLASTPDATWSESTSGATGGPNPVELSAWTRERVYVISVGLGHRGDWVSVTRNPDGAPVGIEQARAEWLAGLQREVSRDCMCRYGGTDTVRSIAETAAEPCRDCRIELVDGAAVTSTGGRCSCAGVEIAVGVQHEPHCGFELVDLMPTELRDQTEEMAT